MIMLLEGLAEFLASPALVGTSVASILVGWYSLDLWKEHHKVSLAYAHLFFVLFPALLFANTITCSMGFSGGLWEFCSLALTKALIYMIPVSLIIALAAGYLLFPRLYQRLFRVMPATKGLSRAIASLSRGLSVKPPMVFIIHSKRAMAFSFSSLGARIFVSTGMISLLTRKELEAVLLHELGHISHRSSISKVSAGLLRAFSPLAWFSKPGSFLAKDEERADKIAAAFQGTNRFLESARAKVRAIHII